MLPKEDDGRHRNDTHRCHKEYLSGFYRKVFKSHSVRKHKTHSQKGNSKQEANKEPPQVKYAPDDRRKRCVPIKQILILNESEIKPPHRTIVVARYRMKCPPGNKRNRIIRGRVDSIGRQVGLARGSPKVIAHASCSA